MEWSRKKQNAPSGAARPKSAHLSGHSRRTDPPLVDRRELTCVSISSHRPLRSLRPVETGRSGAAGDAAFRTRCRQADSAPELSPFHADPVARAIRSWCQSEPSSRRPVGVAPESSALHHCSVSVPRPEGRRSVRLPRRLARFPERPCRSPWPVAPRRDHSTRLDLTPPPVARIRCRLSVVRVSPEGAVRTRSEVAVNSVLLRFRCVS